MRNALWRIYRWNYLIGDSTRKHYRQFNHANY